MARQAIVDNTTGEMILEGIDLNPEYYDMTGKIFVNLPDEFSFERYKWDSVNRIIVDNKDFIKNKRWEEIKELREQVVNGGCDTPLGRVDTTVVSRQNIIGATVELNLVPPEALSTYTKDWTMADNSVLTMSATDIQTMAGTVANFVNACYVRARELREYIEDPNRTYDELYALDITTGWPT